jgi:hypothetical protein
MFKKIIAAFVILLNLSSGSAAYCQNKLQVSSKWTAEIETEEVNDHFVYRNSSLRNLIKAKVHYFPTADESKKTEYEEFWIKDGKGLGLQRFKKIDIPANDDVLIKVKLQSDVSTAQQQSAADAILRLLLELYQNDNILTRIIVPQAALGGISSKIQDHHFTCYKPEGSQAALAVFLQTENGDSTTLYYTR